MKILLALKGILKALPFSGINKYIKICKDTVQEKQQ